MTSATENIKTILDIIEKENPKKILDVGTGFGKFSVLIREAILSGRAEREKDMLPMDDLIINCAEEAPYFYNKPCHQQLYNNHWHDDVMKMPTELVNDHDLVLIIDVLEHWEKELAKKWLSQITTKVLFSTPKRVHFFKEKYYDARNHISQWTEEDFKEANNWEDHSSEKSFIFLTKQ